MYKLHVNDARQLEEHIVQSWLGYHLMLPDYVVETVWISLIAFVLVCLQFWQVKKTI